MPLQSPRRLLKMNGPLFQDIYPTMVMTHELQAKQSPIAIISILYTRKNEKHKDHPFSNKCTFSSCLSKYFKN
jgi:hypothetical protein